MEELLNQLVSLLSQKSRRVFAFFRAHSSENAYEVFRQARPTSKYTSYKVVSGSDTYIILRTRKTLYIDDYERYKAARDYYGDEFRGYYHAVFVIGVDDTMRLFCHRLPWHSEFEYEDFLDTLTYKKVLQYLGIQKHIYEDNFKPKHGIVYRVQGDIGIQVFYFDLGDLIEKLRDHIIVSRINRFREVLKDFLRRTIIDNRDQETVNDEIKRLSYLRNQRKIISYIRYLTRNLPQKYRSLIDPLELKVVYDKNRKLIRKAWFIHNHLDAFVLSISEILFGKLHKPSLSYSATLRALSHNLTTNEKIYNVTIGSHRIRLIGIHINDIPRELEDILRAQTQHQIFSSSFVLIRSQTISFFHDEHKHIAVDIHFDESSQIALVNLRTLNAHRRQVRRR